MMRKKATKGKSKSKRKKVAKKPEKKKGTAKRKKNEKTPGEVRKELAKLVQAHAKKMAKAVIGQGETGQLAPMKYLLEMAHVFPEVNDGSEATREEDCLAKTLLDRLNIPDKPVGRDEEDDFVTIPPRRVLELETESEPEKPGKESAEQEEEEVTVVG